MRSPALLTTILLLCACSNTVADPSAPAVSPTGADGADDSAPEGAGNTVADPGASPAAGTGVEDAGDTVADPGASPPSGTGVEDAGDDMMRGSAPLEVIAVDVMESFPLQARVRVRGYLPDVCTRLEIIEQGTDLEAQRIWVTFSAARPRDAMCATMITPFEETVALDVYGLVAGRYEVAANDLRAKLILETDNVGPGEPTAGRVVWVSLMDPGVRFAVPAGWERDGFEWRDDGDPSSIAVRWSEGEPNRPLDSLLPSDAEIEERSEVAFEWGMGERFVVSAAGERAVVTAVALSETLSLIFESGAEAVAAHDAVCASTTRLLRATDYVD